MSAHARIRPFVRFGRVVRAECAVHVSHVRLCFTEARRTVTDVLAIHFFVIGIHLFFLFFFEYLRENV